MMNVYEFLDGRRIVATDANEFVLKLRIACFHQTNSNAEYMQGFKTRAEVLGYYGIDTSSEESFLDSLLERSIITEILSN